MAIKLNKPICIADIISDAQVVLNIGANYGVSKGDEYIVYGISDKDIIDPSNGANLGRLEIYKGIGKVVHVQDNMCILQAIDNSPLFFLRSSLATEQHSIAFSSPEIGDYAKPNATKVQ